MDRLKSIRVTTETLRAHLFVDEELITDQAGVGLYDGKEKDPTRDDGRLYLTSHRLIYLDAARPDFRSVALSLSLIRQTEYWAGFLTSSPKITLLLGDPTPPSRPLGAPSRSSTPTPLEPAIKTQEEDGVRSWVCRVCGMRNLGSILKCSMCGVNASKEDIAALAAGGPKGPATTTPRIEKRPSTSRLSDILSSSPSNQPEADSGVPCPSCTFLNHRSMGRCEVCDAPLRLSTPSSSTRPPSRPSTPSGTGTHTPNPGSSNYVRLSFRQGGEKPFYAALKAALAASRWDAPSSTAGKGSRTGKSASVGIDGIMKGIELNAQETQNDLEDAFQDLNALMANAKEMASFYVLTRTSTRLMPLVIPQILLAQSLNDRLSAQESSQSNSSSPSLPSETDTKLIRSSLVHLGLSPAVVPSSILKEEQSVHEELAKELGAILSRPRGVMERGIVGLDEVWCAWNRARGISLVSPSDLKMISPRLSLYTSPPIYLRTLKSGLSVLHTSHFSTHNFTRRLLDWLDLRQALAKSLTEAEKEKGKEGATTLEIAQEEKVALGMAKEMVEMCESEGNVVRDEQGGEGVRWYRNYISSGVLV